MKWQHQWRGNGWRNERHLQTGSLLRVKQNNWRGVSGGLSLPRRSLVSAASSGVD